MPTGLRDIAMEWWRKLGRVVLVSEFVDEQGAAQHVCFDDLAFAIQGWVAPSLASTNLTRQSLL